TLSISSISHSHLNFFPTRRSSDLEDYPLHVHLDKRTKMDGTIYTEQLKSFDYINRNWQFVEQLPTDLREEVQNKIQLVVQFNNRSEEQTSELQSRFDLVCRLLLE